MCFLGFSHWLSTLITWFWQICNQFEIPDKSCFGNYFPWYLTNTTRGDQSLAESTRVRLEQDSTGLDSTGLDSGQYTLLAETGLSGLVQLVRQSPVDYMEEC